MNLRVTVIVISRLIYSYTSHLEAPIVDPWSRATAALTDPGGVVPGKRYEVVGSIFMDCHVNRVIRSTGELNPVSPCNAGIKQVSPPGAVVVIVITVSWIARIDYDGMAGMAVARFQIGRAHV